MFDRRTVEAEALIQRDEIYIDEDEREFVAR